MNVLELAGRVPPSGYCQYIPPRDAGGCHFVRHGPPALPPHLLQSVLNADLPEHVSSSFFTFCITVHLSYVYSLALFVSFYQVKHMQLDGKYSERVQLPAKVCPMVLLTWGHFGI